MYFTDYNNNVPYGHLAQMEKDQGPECDNPECLCNMNQDSMHSQDIDVYDRRNSNNNSNNYLH